MLSPNFQPQPDMCAQLPEQTTAFKFSGCFKNYDTGHYLVHWRAKALQDFNIPSGLHFIVKIVYETEPDISGTLDAILPAHKLNILDRDQWYNLTLEEKVVVQPHEGWANVLVMLLNNENKNRDEYSGFLIEHVEIRPVGIRTESQYGVRDMVVQRASVPVMVVDTTRAYPKSQNFSNLPSDAPITRLAVSKKRHYMASLGVSRDCIYITVWDMQMVKNPSRNMNAFYKGSATARILHPDVGDLAIGLAISAYGDQVVVFEEPKIGQWVEGAEAPKPNFKFRLFNNPMVPPISFTLDMDEPSSTATFSEKAQGSTSDEGPDRGRHMHSASVNSPGAPTVGGLLLEEVGCEHEILQSLVGFGEFVPGGRKKEWENSDVGVMCINFDDAEEGTAKETKETKSRSNYINDLFVACNGIYIDVYEITPERRWKRLHTITITDLIPTLSRRITCKMMMDSISNNNFLWLADGGRSCTIWNLRKGSNIAHISSLDNALFKGPTFRGHSKMAISPHESIVALASVDGSLTTYFANTGMAIDDRKFPGYKIEFVGFSSQEDELIVILRDSVSFELIAKQLDTLQLKSETNINQTPIPTIGNTLLTHFNIKGYFGRGLVVEADGTNINCYVFHHPNSSKVNKTSETVLQSDPADVLYESQYDEHIQYRLQTAVHKEPLPEGDGVLYWVHRVEVIREDLKERTQQLIFSFIPEPWMRATTAEVSHPENLLAAFFVPCGMRFAVNGTQTLQIWNLPTHENSKCSLQYIWSQPRQEEDLAPGAEIKINDNSKKVSLSIPGPGIIGAHFAILYCFRSIHLLAAAYAFSSRKGKIASRDDQQSFTFEDHAEAILRFTREHINRIMSIEVYLPDKKSGRGGDNRGNFQAVNCSLKKRPNNNRDQARNFNFPTRSPKEPPTPNRLHVITVLTLLLDHKYLQRANHLFVQGLLNTSNGEWIPRDNQALNPIRRAIETRNTALVEAFIDYCILNAKKYHPAYLMPAIQCLNELSERYPAILADMFRKASYVPAHNHAYVASNALIANVQYTEWFKSKLMFWNFFTGKSFEKSNNINDYEKPVFSLPSQLPFRSTSFLNVLNIETSVRENRRDKFPPKREPVDETTWKRSNRDYKIYVTPFPKLSMYGSYKPWYKGLVTDQSAFTDIAGENFFDSPAMVATLEFKWHKFGFRYWGFRFLFALVFFILIVTITAYQIIYSTGTNILDRYMDSWRPVIIVAVAFGICLCGYEAMQFIYAPRKYIRSPYNYLDLAAYTLAISGCILLLNVSPQIDEDQGMDIGPHQLPVMSFAILFLYFNILSELRVIRQLGIVVNIILNITRSITWFFIIFLFILVSFAHALMHLLQTKSYHPDCPPDLPTNGAEIPAELEFCITRDDYPTGFFSALSATYFFLAGRYDPIATSLKGSSISFHIMMVLFFFISVILFLNILIALMNDAFNESKNQGQLAWLKQWSEVIAEVEGFLMTQHTRQNRNYFPDYIFYGANEQEAEPYESRFFIASKSNLSIESRFIINTVEQKTATQLSQRQVLKDVQTLGNGLEKLNMKLEKLKSNQEDFNQDIIRLTEVVAAYLATTTAARSQESSSQGSGSDENDDDYKGDDDGSFPSHSHMEDSPANNNPPTSGVSMGETQRTPGGAACGPPSQPVPSPPPPTAVLGAIISLPSPGSPIAPSGPPPTRASSAPMATTIPTIASNSSSSPYSASSQNASYPIRASFSRPIAVGPSPAPDASCGPYPISAGSSPSYPASSNTTSSSMLSYPKSSPTPPPQLPSYPRSAASPAAPQPALFSVPVQTPMPYSMPIPVPPLSTATGQNTIDLNTGLNLDVEESKSAPTLKEMVQQGQEEGKLSLSSPYKINIDADFNIEKNAPSWGDMGGEKKEKIKESKMRKESEDGEEASGGGASNPDIPASSLLVITRPLHSSAHPVKSKKAQTQQKQQYKHQQQQQSAVSAPSTILIPAPIPAPAVPQQAQAGQKFKKTIADAETIDSPTSFTSTTDVGADIGGDWYSPPFISTTQPIVIPAPWKRQQQQSQSQQQQQQQPIPSVPSQLPAGGPAVYHSDIGGSSNKKKQCLPCYKVIEPQDLEHSPTWTQTTPTSTNTTITNSNTLSPFRQSVQKIVAVQTVSDALRAQRRIEDNNVFHPIYIVPQSASSGAHKPHWYHLDSDEDGLNNDDDDEDHDKELEVIEEDDEEGHSRSGSSHRRNKGKNVRSSTAPTLHSLYTDKDIQA
ncbi:hypothetical protein BGZ95_009790 [Linnemannia exigua]|uniref:Ion transport domain-containing protein n=1 Tax=Linnemannia exigua TaxID=604196 RepID=A0AAD4DCF8_9FUNG|nr:hypothetical protein BGZ95_009790 [Linnemannia exigua]